MNKWIWQGIIFTSIIALGLIDDIVLGIVAGIWATWTALYAWKKSKLLPLQLGTIVLAAVICVIIKRIVLI